MQGNDQRDRDSRGGQELYHRVAEDMQHGEELIRGSEDFLRSSENTLQSNDMLLQHIRKLRDQKHPHLNLGKKYDATIQTDETPMQATLLETYEE
eukprot:9741998-Alexandrium_andersonii.AAC.1